MVVFSNHRLGPSAELLVSVGSHFNLVEFLDKNRRGMASTFLTRLRVGEILVDAKVVRERLKTIVEDEDLRKYIL